VQRGGEPAQHDVERGAQPAGLGARIAVGHPTIQLSTGDRLGGVLDPGQRSQPEPDHDRRDPPDEEQHDPAHDGFDDQKLPQYDVHRAQRQRDGHDLIVRELYRLDLPCAATGPVWDGERLSAPMSHGS
jgi:hypothetical protein